MCGLKYHVTGATNGSFPPNICSSGKCLLARRCERNDMSLEGKCCWEKGNSGFRIADMFYLSETFSPAHPISSLPPPPPVSQVAGCRCTLLVGNSSVSLAGPGGVRNKYIFFQQSPKMLKMTSESFIHTSLLF